MGDSPPEPRFVDDDVFERNKDVVWCRRDTKGRLYRVNKNGELCARPKKCVPTEGRDDEDARRPQEVSPYF